jgi:hypothetical protein
LQEITRAKNEASSAGVRLDLAEKYNGVKLDLNGLKLDLAEKYNGLKLDLAQKYNAMLMLMLGLITSLVGIFISIYLRWFWETYKVVQMLILKSETDCSRLLMEISKSLAELGLRVS